MFFSYGFLFYLDTVAYLYFKGLFVVFLDSPNYFISLVSL